MLLLIVLCIVLSGVILSLVPSRKAVAEPRWKAKNFKSLITFGDSYTDEGRGTYFARHNNTAPPPGTIISESYYTPGGGRTWARYIIQYTGSSDGRQWNPKMTLYNYAVGGSFCTGEIVPRKGPSMREYAVPAFAVDVNGLRYNSTEPYFQPAMTPSNAVIAIWIGTNDLGEYSYLTNDQIRGKVISDYTDCVFDAIDGMYAAGGRTFVIMNTAPLHLCPLYANTTLHGEGGPNGNWRGEKILEITSSANNIYRYKTPYEFVVANRYPDAQVALFDVWTFMREMYFHPNDYYNGTLPANVTSFVDKSKSTKSSPDSFMWGDRLHPSEQTDRQIAREFIKLLDGRSKYAEYW